eukprot:COSAG01_NODE_295_length_19292_cov_726.304538_3_plen_33_part_00
MTKAVLAIEAQVFSTSNALITVALSVRLTCLS